LSRGRKYHCSLVLNHQFQAQLDEETRAAIFGNCGTCIVFAVGARDTELLTQQLGGGVTASDLAHLPKYHAYCSLMIDGKSHDPFLMQTILPPQATLSGWRVAAMIDRSRARYARPAQIVDAQIADQLGIAGKLSGRTLKIPASSVNAGRSERHSPPSSSAMIAGQYSAPPSPKASYSTT
jgi:hypothetical protein